MTVPAEYFDAMYAAASDPWGFEDRWYERRKRAIRLALLLAAVTRAGCRILRASDEQAVGTSGAV